MRMVTFYMDDVTRELGRQAAALRNIPAAAFYRLAISKEATRILEQAARRAQKSPRPDGGRGKVADTAV